MIGLESPESGARERNRPHVVPLYRCCASCVVAKVPQHSCVRVCLCVCVLVLELGAVRRKFTACGPKTPLFGVC